MQWHVGDRAVILNSRFPGRIGTYVTIMSELIYINPIFGTELSRPMHMLDIGNVEYPDYPAFYRPEWLGPTPDDKHKRFHEALISSKWSDCEWNPMVTVQTGQTT